MDRRIIWANPAYRGTMGLAAHQIIGRNPLSFALPRARRPSDIEITNFRFGENDPTVNELHLRENVSGYVTVFWNQINTSQHVAPNGEELIILVCRDVPEQFRSVVRQTNLVARVGGDEFAVVCHGLRDIQKLQKIGQILMESLEIPLQWNDQSILCGINIGASISHPSTSRAAELLQESDFALYDVKRSGRGRVMAYDDTLHRRHTHERCLARDLNDAVRKGGPSFLFDPILAVSDGTIQGLETIIVWNHPTLGRIDFDKFSGVAKKIGVMAYIDFAAVDAALSIKTELNTANHTSVRVAFNASSECLAHPQFLTRLMAGLTTLKISSISIAVELRELDIFQTNDRTAAQTGILKQLSEKGFITLLDDFGMGRSGLGHLAQLYAKAIKIYRRLTQNIGKQSVDHRILKTILRLCDDLDIYPIYAGVQSQEQCDIIENIGGQTVQGVFFKQSVAAGRSPVVLNPSLDAQTHRKRSAIAPTKNERYLGANS
jgi:predicted signal transduction protein with EAL and GGDEF domain